MSKSKIRKNNILYYEVIKKEDLKMEVEKLLDNEIESVFGELNTIELGSEKYRVTVDELVKLLDKKLDIQKFQSDNYDKDVAREDNNNFRLKQMEDEKKDRLWKNGLAIATIIVPSVITIWGTLKTFKFEEEGTVTSIIGRNFINKLVPKK